MKPIKYGETPSFENFVKSINILHQDGFPTLEFKGSIKLHGTNTSFRYDDDLGLMLQSRKNIVDSGLFDYPATMATEIEFMMKLINQVKSEHSIDTGQNTIVIYGEWAGEGIHPRSAVAIGTMRKCFYLYAVKIKPHDNNSPSWYIPEVSHLQSESDFIDNIWNYKTFSITLDFTKPLADAQNTIYNMVQTVEDECPVAKTKANITGMGEGIVFSAFDDQGVRHFFKAKGDKHSSSRAKSVKKVDATKVNAIREFAETVATESRVEQALHELGIETDLDRKHTGKVLEWVKRDVIKEESLTISELVKTGISEKQLLNAVSAKTRTIFFNIIKTQYNVESN